MGGKGGVEVREKQGNKKEGKEIVKTCYIIFFNIKGGGKGNVVRLPKIKDFKC